MPEYEVTIQVTGTATFIVEAEDEDDAKLEGELASESDWGDVKFDESATDVIAVKPYEM
jgi:hypothetical protein